MLRPTFHRRVLAKLRALWRAQPDITVWSLPAGDDPVPRLGARSTEAPRRLFLHGKIVERTRK